MDWKSELLNEPFAAGRRRYFVELKELEQGNRLLKVTELSGGRKSSFILAREDLESFREKFATLAADLNKSRSFKLDCSFEKDRQVNVDLSKNEKGAYFCLKSQTLGSDRQPKIFIDADRKDEVEYFISLLDKVIEFKE